MAVVARATSLAVMKWQVRTLFQIWNQMVVVPAMVPDAGNVCADLRKRLRGDFRETPLTSGNDLLNF